MKLNFKQYGIIRNPEADFSDDGNRFTAYLYKELIPITYLKSNGQVYLSVSIHNLPNINYDEYRNFKSYVNYDKYNGIDEDKIDLVDFQNICEQAYIEYVQFKENLKAPDYAAYKEYCEKYYNYYNDLYETVKKFISSKMDKFLSLDKFTFESIGSYCKSIKSNINRYSESDKGTDCFKRRELSADSLQRQQKYLDEGIEGNYYSKQIIDILNK